jgi:hypothetical protein
LDRGMMVTRDPPVEREFPGVLAGYVELITPSLDPLVLVPTSQ